MAIYKLEEIATFKNGSTPSTKLKKFWKKEIPFFGPGDLESCEENRWISKSYGKLMEPGTILISTTATIGNIGILKKKSWFNQQITSIKAENNIVYDKYLYYFFKSKQLEIRKIKSNGSIFTIIPISLFKSWIINLPNLSKQKQIIDIIEPIEKLILLMVKLIRKLNFICDNLTKINYKITSDKYQYHKGELPHGNGKTSFLNVSAANGNINRKVSNEPNIFQGDVTLSLDGNTGIVNRNLNGFNGYLYKVTSYKHKNYQIFFSLKHSYNQRIIKINETGTTIKHSPHSKKQIKHIEFYNDEFLAKCYNILNKMDDILILLNNQKIKMMKLLVK